MGFRGELEQFRLFDVLQMIATTGMSGRLVLSRRSARGLVVFREGRIVYSPIVHSHPLALLGLPSDWPFWAEHNRAMLERSDVLAVLTLPGWKESRGVAAEIEIATTLRLPLRYDEPGAFVSEAS